MWYCIHNKHFEAFKPSNKTNEPGRQERKRPLLKGLSIEIQFLALIPLSNFAKGPSRAKKMKPYRFVHRWPWWSVVTAQKGPKISRTGNPWLLFFQTLRFIFFFVGYMYLWVLALPKFSLDWTISMEDARASFSLLALGEASIPS